MRLHLDGRLVSRESLAETASDFFCVREGIVMTCRLERDVFSSIA